MSTQEELMKQMLAGAQPVPGAVMPNMPVMPNLTPTQVAAPVQTEPNIHQMTMTEPSPEQMAAFMAQHNPVVAPAIVDDHHQPEAAIAQVAQSETIVAQVQQVVATSTPAMEIPAIPVVNQAVGTTMNIQNGLDLDSVMTPEEQVKLEVQEVVVTPITIGGLESIGSCKTSVWSALITILDFIAKELGNNDIIAIDKGTIDTQRDGIFIHCDMKNILGNISLNLTSPADSVKLLKLIRGGELVQIFKEDSTNNYIFCNIQDSKVLTRVKTSFAADQVDGFGKAPFLGNPIFQKEIPQAEKEIIKTIIAGKSAIGSDEPYRFGFSKVDNTLVSIGVGKDFTYFFKDSSIEVDEYRCWNPFPVPNMESCIIRFFKKADDNTTWVQTVSNINPSSIICTEKVELIDSSIEDFNFN